MPKNIACSVGLLAWLIQPMRYAWEVVLPRSYFNRPAVLSTCWIIYREELERLGAFAAVSHKIVPESYFAKEEMKKGVYSFVMSNDQLAVESIKNVDDQLDTAIRTRYPQFHRKPEYICLSGLIEMLLALLPIACLCYMFSRFNFYLTFLSVVDIFTLSTLFGLIMNTTYQRKLWILGLLFPFGLAFDVFISNYSMWKYEFSQIIWKGRDVSNIVMRVYPKLS
jgi:hypothetical protein